MKPPVALIAGVVAVVGIAVAGVIFLSQGISENARVIIINALVLAIFGVIPGMFALAKIERVENKTEEMHHELKNGLIPAKVTEAITDMAADPNVSSVVINSESHNAAYERGVERGLSGD